MGGEAVLEAQERPLDEDPGEGGDEEAGQQGDQEPAGGHVAPAGQAEGAGGVAEDQRMVEVEAVADLAEADEGRVAEEAGAAAVGMVDGPSHQAEGGEVGGEDGQGGTGLGPVEAEALGQGQESAECGCGDEGEAWVE